MNDLLGSAGQWQPAITYSHQTGASIYLSSDGLSLTVISRIHGSGGKLHPPVSLELLTRMPFQAEMLVFRGLRLRLHRFSCSADASFLLDIYRSSDMRTGWHCK